MDFLSSPTFWIKTLQLLLSLGFLVFVHELGHCLIAKLFHTRVEKFYLFFNPRFSLFRMKKFDGKWHFAFLSKNTDENDEWSKHPENTEWGIGWLPLGGYCAIAGMVDETHSADELSKEPQPWEFRAKNVWQRLLIISGGILVNFITALLLFIIILYTWGEQVLPLKNMPQGLYYCQSFLQQGFQQRDRIVLIDGEEPYVLADVIEKVVIEGKTPVVVQRGDSLVELNISEDLGKRFLAEQQDFDRAERDHHRADNTYRARSFVGLSPYYPMVIAAVQEGHAAHLAGIETGDSIVSINGIVTPSFFEVQAELKKHPCDSIQVGLVRKGEYLQKGAFIGDQCLLGVMTEPMLSFCTTETREYGFWESIPAGIRHGWEKLVQYIKQFRLVFSKEGAQSVGGFGAIGSLFPSMWDWQSFWYMTAYLSLILAFMNFLPIPALDGGYILFLLVEIITRKQPSDKFLEKANEVGFWLLIALLILANGNDLLKIFF